MLKKKGVPEFEASFSNDELNNSYYAIQNGQQVFELELANNLQDLDSIGPKPQSLISIDKSFPRNMDNLTRKNERQDELD